VKALQNLQQQLQCRTHTYLYQIDGLLQTAHDAVAAFTASLAAAEPATAVLQLCALALMADGRAPANGIASAEALQRVCCLVWVGEANIYAGESV
jgi:hypothetical protein